MIVTKPDSIRDLGEVDIYPLRKLLDLLPDEFWDIEDERKENNFSVFENTQHIIFRFIPNNYNHLDYYSNPIWQIWGPELLPVMERAVKAYKFIDPIYPKVMLARLRAGHTIERHVDGLGSNLHTHKLHIPIQTTSNATFSVGGFQIHLKEGRGYEVNNVIPHSAENNSDQDRIHLIFEVFDNALQ